MDSEQDKQRENVALLERLESLYPENLTEPKEPVYVDVCKIINLVRAAGFCTDQEERTEIEKKLEALTPKDNFIDISVSLSELLLLKIGLLNSIQCLEPEQYVEKSIGDGMSSEQRWSKVAEIMLIKKPDEKPRKHSEDELIYYYVHIDRGANPRKAAEEVFKKFKFSSQHACDKWLSREIESRKKADQGHGLGLFANLPKPSSWPRPK